MLLAYTSHRLYPEMQAVTVADLHEYLLALERRAWTDAQLKTECVSKGVVDDLISLAGEAAAAECADASKSQHVASETMQCSSVSCLAALAHGEASVRDVIVRKGAVERLLAVVHHCKGKPSKLLECSLLALRKLTCSPKSHPLFTKCSHAVSNLLTLCQLSTETKPQSAFTAFDRVTADCQLVGCVVTNKHVYLGQCVYSLDLYDTTGDEDISVHELLVKSGDFTEYCEEVKSCKDKIGTFWVSVMVKGQLNEEMRFMAQLRRIKRVGNEMVLLPLNEGKDVLCCLHGLQLSNKHVIVEHALGILKNITSLRSDIRWSVIKLDGVKTMLKLLTRYGDHLSSACAATAVAVITHLALDQVWRQRIGNDAVEPLLMLLKATLLDYKESHAVRNSTLDCLKNLVLGCPANRTKVLDGSQRLAIFDAAKRSASKEVRETVLRVMKNLFAYVLDEASRENWAEVVAKEWRMARRGKHRGDGPGEWISHPTIGFFSSDISKRRTHEESLQSFPASSSDGKFYGLKEKVEWSVDETHDIQLGVLPTNRMIKSLCSFLNTGQGGTIYFGINQDTRCVQGVKLSRKMRDMFRTAGDRLLIDCKPSVPPDVCMVSFVPVQTSKGLTSLTDVYVVEFNIKKFASGTIYYTPTGDCYIRKGARNVQMIAQLLKENTLRREEQQYATQIKSLHADITAVRRQLQKLNI